MSGNGRSSIIVYHLGENTWPLWSTIRCQIAWLGIIMEPYSRISADRLSIDLSLSCKADMNNYTLSFEKKKSRYWKILKYFNQVHSY